MILVSLVVQSVSVVLFDMLSQNTTLFGGSTNVETECVFSDETKSQNILFDSVVVMLCLVHVVYPGITA